MIKALLYSIVSAISLFDQNPDFQDIELEVQQREHVEERVREAIAQCQQGEYEKALPVLKSYEAKDDIGARYMLAKLYQSGRGLEQSLEKAAELFQKNVEKGHPASMVLLGEIREREEQFAMAMQLYQLAAEGDSALAILKLGDIYERGLLGVKKNPKLAFSNFQKLSEAGFSDGHYHLARCYSDGIGVSTDALRATGLFRQAGLAGHSRSQVTMARRYFNGQGVETDPVAAIGWLTRAAQDGSNEARVLLALRYENGDSTRQDFNTAGQLLSAAAKEGDASALYHLARYYGSGIGTKVDLVRAYVLLTQAGDFPPALEALEKLKGELSEEQLAEARKKVAEEVPDVSK